MRVDGKQLGFAYRKPKGKLERAEESAKKRRRLSHYTCVDTLKIILESKTLLFNRIDKVNDGLESKLFNCDKIAHLVYVSCFTLQRRESIPMWKLYGKGSNGVRIEFELIERDFSESLIDKEKNAQDQNKNPVYSFAGEHPNVDWYSSFVSKDMVYDYDLIKQEPIKDPTIMVEKNKPAYYLTPMGAIKREEWRYEKECRLIAYLRTTRKNVEIPDSSYLIVPIKFDKISKITITFNPWMNDASKDDLKRFVDGIPELKDKAIYKDSILTGEIREL